MEGRYHERFSLTKQEGLVLCLSKVTDGNEWDKFEQNQCAYVRHSSDKSVELDEGTAIFLSNLGLFLVNKKSVWRSLVTMSLSFN